jgi:hypothetical protein
VEDVAKNGGEQAKVSFFDLYKNVQLNAEKLMAPVCQNKGIKVQASPYKGARHPGNLPCEPTSRSSSSTKKMTIQPAIEENKRAKRCFY